MNKTIILFGSTGDLAKRKLFPALYEIYKKGAYNLNIIATGRRVFNDNEFRDYVNSSTDDFIKKGIDFSDFLKKIFYTKVEITNSSDYENLSKKLEKYTDQEKIIYLSVSPTFFEEAINNLGKYNLNTKEYKIILEKPFGKDLNSARNLNNTIYKAYSEVQVYRIDHYLGKEAFQNILAFRFGNSIFEPIWNSKYIDNIQIVATETLGVGTRGGYYDQSGALRDMIQNHLFQVLSFITMDKPENLDSKSISKKRVDVFNSLNLEENFSQDVVFGQYLGYRNEKGVVENSRTETFAALKLEVANDKFKGVPIFLKSGKSLYKKQTKIIIEFKNTSNLFKNQTSNKIIIETQEKDSIKINFNGKEVNKKDTLRSIISEFINEESIPEAYERLLTDTFKGDKLLFTDWSILEPSWKIVDRLVNCKDNCPIIHKYEQGSKGPSEANILLEKTGRNWN